MSTSYCTCGKPTRDAAYVCEDCLTDFAKALGDVPWVDEELEVSITRQRSSAIGSGARGTHTALPWHEKASDAQRALRNVLVSWIRVCIEERVRNQSAAQDWPADTMPAMSRWLLWRVDGLAFHEAGAEAAREVINAVADAERIVFWKRRERVYLGNCESPMLTDGTIVRCQGEVYADEGAAVAWCEACGADHDVEKRRAELEQKLDDKLCTAAEIARLATYLGLDQPREQVRNRVNQWHKRKRIHASGHDAQGDPTFLYGDVRPLLAQLQRRDTA